MAWPSSKMKCAMRARVCHLRLPFYRVLSNYHVMCFPAYITKWRDLSSPLFFVSEGFGYFTESTRINTFLPSVGLLLFELMRIIWFFTLHWKDGSKQSQECCWHDYRRHRGYGSAIRRSSSESNCYDWSYSLCEIGVTSSSPESPPPPPVVGLHVRNAGLFPKAKSVCLLTIVMHSESMYTIRGVSFRRFVSIRIVAFVYLSLHLYLENILCRTVDRHARTNYVDYNSK